jgi:hypothetical protein
LAHPQREATHPPARRLGQANLLKHLVGPGEGQAGGGGDDLEVVAGAAAGMEAGRLQDRADLADGVGQLPIRPAVDPGRPRGRGDQPQQHAQGGGLAGPVGAQEPDHRALVDLEAQVVDGDDPSEALGESVDGDDRHRSPPLPSAGLLVEAGPVKGVWRLDGTERRV